MKKERKNVYTCLIILMFTVYHFTHTYTLLQKTLQKLQQKLQSFTMILQIFTTKHPHTCVSKQEYVDQGKKVNKV